MIEGLIAVDSFRKANIYSPLLDIYNLYKNYDKINLHRNILLLTNGKIEYEEDTLRLSKKIVINIQFFRLE